MSCSKFDKQQSEQSMEEMLKQVKDNVEDLRDELLRERFKVEHFVRNIRDDDPEPEEIEFIIPRSLMKQLLGGHKRVIEEIETGDFTEGEWVRAIRATDFDKYFKDGKTPSLFKKLDRIIDDDLYFYDEAHINDYFLDWYEIRTKKELWGWRGNQREGCIVFEIKLNFVKEEMVECCITEEDVPKRASYYNGEVYMSKDAYEEFTRCHRVN